MSRPGRRTSGAAQGGSGWLQPVPDRTPLVTISVLIRCGNYLDPADKSGLAEFTGYLLAQGGTQSRRPRT